MVALAPLHATDATAPRALPLNAPTGPLDSVSFATFSDGVNHKITVTTSRTLLRVDEPDDRWSIIYDPATQFYTGLEHGNYTYWSFSWPEVRGVVEGSKRGEKRLQDMSSTASIPTTRPPPPTCPPPRPHPMPPRSPPATTPATSGNRGPKRSASAGSSASAGPALRSAAATASFGATTAPLPRVTAAVARLREVDEPITLVPIRTVVPDFIFPVYDALGKSGLTPVQINWGSDTEKGEFRLIEQKTRSYEAKLFTVPTLYRQTTLITLDGMIPEQPMPGSRSTPARRVDHLAPTPGVTPTAPPLPGGNP